MGSTHLWLLPLTLKRPLRRRRVLLPVLGRVVLVPLGARHRLRHAVVGVRHAEHDAVRCHAVDVVGEGLVSGPRLTEGVGRDVDAGAEERCGRERGEGAAERVAGEGYCCVGGRCEFGLHGGDGLVGDAVPLLEETFVRLYGGAADWLERSHAINLLYSSSDMASSNLGVCTYHTPITPAHSRRLKRHKVLHHINREVLDIRRPPKIHDDLVSSRIPQNNALRIRLGVVQTRGDSRVVWRGGTVIRIRRRGKGGVADEFVEEVLGNCTCISM